MKTQQLSLLDRDWVELNIPVLIQTMTGREFTTDDAHRVFDEPENRNLVGVMFAKLRCQGRIRRIGYRPSTRPEANGRVVAVWMVTATATAATARPVAEVIAALREAAL